MKITPPPQHVSFPKLELSVLKGWKKNSTFAASLAKNPESKRYTFYDGPPFATGKPHYGGLLQGTIKDIVPRFRTMQGYYVERRFGWDCHGLPVEYEMEKELGIRSRQEILEMGVDKFNEACRGIVLRYTKDWEEVTTRLGRWVDFENDYKTMDPDYMETIWWELKQLWGKKLLYEGRKSMHICPRCATPLSNYEVSLGYAERTDPAVYVKFPLADNPDVSLLAWTTTPWTLPANVLLAVNPEVGYVEVEHDANRYILAKKRIEATFEGQAVKILRKVPAKELLGARYTPPFPLTGLDGLHYTIVSADFVTDEEGTGIAHEAPAFGEEDMALAQKVGAPLVQHVDITGHFTDPFPRYHDKTALEGNDDIISDLKKSDRLLRRETISHSYPHCWRCDTPLLNYAAVSWFVNVTKLKKRLIKNNEPITWMPEHTKHGRFGKGLADAPDWSISRNRFWGNPLPIWRCEKEHTIVIGSLDELEKLSGERPSDLHKHFVDKITFACPDCTKPMRRIEDVLDCWFESGSMPYGSQHYPFEHDKDFEKGFPADFIAEGLDQTRGWFYTLHVLATALKDSPAFLHAVCTGLIMAEDGKKMSKRLKNYPEPELVFDEFGADALRMYLVTSPVVRGENLNFSEKGVEEVLRRFNLTLWNSYCFFATYAAVDQWKAVGPPKKPKHLLDRWVLSRTNTLAADVTKALESNDLMPAGRLLVEFLDELSNWYIRRSRRRFWKSEDDQDKAEAYATLYYVLTTYCKLAAPFAPFLTEHIYQALTGEDSVHLTDWPKPRPDYREQALERDMAAARDIVSLGLAARSTAKTKVRQPLREARIIDHEDGTAKLNKDIVQIIASELNVKNVHVVQEDSSFVKTLVQPVPAKLGPLLGTHTQGVIAALKKGSYEIHPDHIVTAGRKIPLEAVRVSYEPDGDFVVASSQDHVVGLSTDLDKDLRDEGTARELIRAIQDFRKDSKLQVDDRISLGLVTESPALQRAIDTHRDLITDEVLARSLELSDPVGDNRKLVTIDGNRVEVSLSKI